MLPSQGQSLRALAGGLFTVKRLSDLSTDPLNANKGTQRGLRLHEESLRRCGAGRSILVDRNGVIIAGNKTAERAADLGLDEVIVVPTDGTKLVAVQRIDLDLGADPRARELAVADNRVSEVNYEPDPTVLAQILQDGVELGEYYSEKEMERILAAAVQEEPEPVVPVQLSQYPLAIILTHAQWEQWQEHKKSVGVRDDTEAFLRLLGG